MEMVENSKKYILDLRIKIFQDNINKLRFPYKLIVSKETLIIKEQKVQWQSAVLWCQEVMIHGSKITSQMFDIIVTEASLRRHLRP